MPVVILAGGIDLSAGTAVALSAVVLAVGLKQGYPWPAAAAGGVAAGGLGGRCPGAAAGAARARWAVLLAVGLKQGYPWPAAVAGCVAAGGLCGLFNGAVVAKGRVVP